MEKKKVLKVLVIFLVGILLAIFLIQNITPEKENHIDLSDISNMNIGAEMPKLIYGDDEKVILHGTFGIIVFDLNSHIVINRISHQSLDEMNVKFPVVYASLNGEYLYIDNDFGSWEYVYKYNVYSGKIQQVSEIDRELFTVKNVDLYRDESYREFVNPNYILGEQIIENENNYLYLRAELNWSMESLQIIIFDKETHTDQIINVF